METLEQIVQDLAARLEIWLKTPDEASRGVLELRERLQALSGVLGAKAKNGALSHLGGAEKDIWLSRCSAASAAISSACRPLNVILRPEAPLRRVRRAQASTSARAVAPKDRSAGSAPKLANGDAANPKPAPETAEPQPMGEGGR